MASDVMEQGFLKIPSSALVASLVLHIAVPILFVTFTFLDEKGWLPFPKKKPLTSEMFQNFIQVDVVALPDELLNDKKNSDMSLPIVEKPVAVKEDVTVPTKDDMAMPEDQAEKDRLGKKKISDAAEKAAQEKKRLAEEQKALKQMQQEAAREAALKSLSKNDTGKAGRTKNAGNQKSSGTSIFGVVGTPKDKYTARVAQAVRDHFNIYPWQKKKILVNEVHIEIFPTGRIRSKRMIKPSADPLFDSAVMRAIEEASPLPLPDDLSLIEDGITFNFKPE